MVFFLSFSFYRNVIIVTIFILKQTFSFFLKNEEFDVSDIFDFSRCQLYLKFWFYSFQKK